MGLKNTGFADKIAGFLPTAVKRIEEGHFLPFKKPFKVYVFSTQKSHNESVGSTTSYPIWGTAVQGNVFIAPSAFSASFLEYFEMSPEEMWNRFKSELLSTGNKGNSR